MSFLDDFMAKQVSLLATELQLCMRQPDKALTLINYLENNLMYGGSIPLKGFDKSGKEKKVGIQKLKTYKLTYILNYWINKINFV